MKTAPQPAAKSKSTPRWWPTSSTRQKTAIGRVGVRIHDRTHPHWRQDLDILISRAGERIAYIVLPKAERAADVLEQIGILDATRARYGVTREIPYMY